MSTDPASVNTPIADACMANRGLLLCWSFSLNFRILASISDRPTGDYVVDPRLSVGLSTSTIWIGCT